jgi:transposase
VQRVKDGQGVSAMARELGMSVQTLRNLVKESETGKLNGARGEGRRGRTDWALASANGKISACRWRWKPKKTAAFFAKDLL